MNLVDACALKSGENSSPSAGSIISAHSSCAESGMPGDGPRPCKERPERGSEETEWRRRHISRTASAFLGVGDEIHSLMSTGPRPRVDMMPRNDTWRGRDAHQGWPRGSVLGGWGGVARSGSAGVALAVGRGLAARLSEENRCESQQRNPYRLRPPQEASSRRVDRCFIRRKRASQSKMRLRGDFSPQIDRQIPGRFPFDLATNCILS